MIYWSMIKSYYAKKQTEYLRQNTYCEILGTLETKSLVYNLAII